MKSIKLYTYPLNIKVVNQQKMILDIIRNKYLILTPEEFVRQNLLLNLINEKKYPKSLIAVEYPLKHIDKILRCDIVVFNKNSVPDIIIECKAPDVNINQKVIDQAANYNSKLKVNYMAVSNGNKTYCCKLDYIKHKYEYLDDFPTISEIKI